MVSWNITTVAILILKGYYNIFERIIRICDESNNGTNYKDLLENIESFKID